MFTGIIEKLGILKKIKRKGKGFEIYVKIENSNLKKGDSVSVDGTCLTVEEKINDIYRFYISEKTLKSTKFSKSLKIGQIFNIEEPLTLNKFVGGHIVQGHVDFCSKIKEIKKIKEEYEFTFELDKEFKPYIFEKASVAIDGVSLTVQEVKKNMFKVMIIPYTYENTNFRYKKKGDYVNVECDFIIKGVISYLKKLH